MASRQKQVQILKKILKPYNLRIRETNGHRVIENANGQAVYWFASTPTCEYFAENTLSDLVKMGLVDSLVKNKKIR